MAIDPVPTGLIYHKVYIWPLRQNRYWLMAEMKRLPIRRLIIQ